MTTIALVALGVALGLGALGSYAWLLRRRLEQRLAGGGYGWVAAAGSWLVVGALIGAGRLAGVEAVWVAAATFLVAHRIWLRANVRALARSEGGTP